eukprot:SM000059S18729  [mRNA]  locus=s59:656014:657802:- [translate_table: standard]
MAAEPTSSGRAVVAVVVDKDSGASQAALTWALAHLANGGGSELVLLYIVTRVPNPIGTYDSVSESKRLILDGHLRFKVRPFLEKHAAFCRGRGAGPSAPTITIRIGENDCAITGVIAEAAAAGATALVVSRPTSIFGSSKTLGPLASQCRKCLPPGCTLFVVAKGRLVHQEAAPCKELVISAPKSNVPLTCDSPTTALSPPLSVCSTPQHTSEIAPSLSASDIPLLSVVSISSSSISSSASTSSLSPTSSLCSTPSWRSAPNFRPARVSRDGTMGNDEDEKNTIHILLERTSLLSLVRDARPDDILKGPADELWCTPH